MVTGGGDGAQTLYDTSPPAHGGDFTLTVEADVDTCAAARAGDLVIDDGRKLYSRPLTARAVAAVLGD